MNFSLSTVLNTLIGSSLFTALAVLLICRCAANRSSGSERVQRRFSKAGAGQASYVS